MPRTLLLVQTLLVFLTQVLQFSACRSLRSLTSVVRRRLSRGYRSPEYSVVLISFPISVRWLLALRIVAAAGGPSLAGNQGSSARCTVSWRAPVVRGPSRLKWTCRPPRTEGGPCVPCVGRQI